jgi:hypothetical protein
MSEDRALRREAATWAGWLFAILMLRTWGAGPLFLVDPDLGWHLRYGHEILAAMALPAVDTWSAYSQGQGYHLTQWLGQVILASAELAGGNFGLSLVTSAAIAVGITSSFLACRLFGASRQGAMLGTLATAGCMIWGVTRPVVFTWCLTGVSLLLVAGFRRDGRYRWLAGMAALAVLWPSIHGGFAMGLPMMALGLIGVVLSSERYERDFKLRLIALMLTVLAAASLLNPYGWGVWQAAGRVAMLDTTTNDMFSDWHRVAPVSGLALPLWVGMASVLWGSWKRLWPLWVGAAGLLICGLGWLAARNVPVVAAMVSPFVALALTGLVKGQACAVCAGAESRPMQWVAWPLAALLALASLAKGSESFSQAEKMVYPVEAGEKLRASGLKAGVVLSEVEHGGWWIRRHPELRVWIDGRADLHGDEAYRRLGVVLGMREGWQEQLRLIDPQVVSVRARSALFKADLGPEFEVVVDNGYSKVWRRTARSSS